MSEDYDLMDKVEFKALKGAFRHCVCLVILECLECNGDLLFKRSNRPVTTDHIRAMPNSTLAGSPKGCARACFSAQNCQVNK